MTAVLWFVGGQRADMSFASVTYGDLIDVLRVNTVKPHRHPALRGRTGVLLEDDTTCPGVTAHLLSELLLS